MPTETRHINAYDNGWLFGGLTAIDEAVASADGNSIQTTTDNDVAVMGIQNFTVIQNLDTVTSVQLTARVKKINGGFPEPSLPKIDFEVLIGGSSQGTTRVTATTSFSNKTVTNGGWDADWSVSQLNGLQVRATHIRGTGTSNSTSDIDCIDVIVTYTEFVPEIKSGSGNPSINTLTASGVVKIDRVREPAKGAIALSTFAPTLFHDSIRQPAKGAIVVAGQAVTVFREDNVLPSGASVSLSGKSVVKTVDFIARPAAYALTLAPQAVVKIDAATRIPATRPINFTTYIPVSDPTDDTFAFPPRKQCALATEAPLIHTTTNNLVGPGRLPASLVGHAPTLDQTTHRFIDVPAYPVTLLGIQPQVVQSQVRATLTGSLSLTGKLAFRVPGTPIEVGSTTLSLATFLPFLQAGPASLDLTTFAPTALVNYRVNPAVRTLAISGKNVFSHAGSVGPGELEAVLTTYAPTISFTSFFGVGPYKLISLTVDRDLQSIATPIETLVD